MASVARPDRRRFLSQTALAGAAIALPGTRIRLKPDPTFAWAEPDHTAVRDLPSFRPSLQAPDAEVFAAARKRLLFPDTVTYCNTGTLGASPREVVDAMNQGLDRLEHDLPDWPYFQADGEPLTGYQMLLDARTRLGALVGAAPEEIAITLNATMGMNFIANG